jgi:hypothetical protein
MSPSALTSPRTAPALPLSDRAPSEVRVLLDLEVTEHVVYGFSCALDLPADEAAHLLSAAQDERSAWANDNEDAWLDELPIAGAAGVVEVAERTAVCYDVRSIPAETVCVRQDQARLAAAVALVAAQLSDDAREQFEALALGAGLLLRCECGRNLALDEVPCRTCRRTVSAG